MNRELYIHIGYPRTGTTTLRECLFPNHSELTDISLDIMNYFFQGKSYDYVNKPNIILDHRENAFNRNIDLHKKNLEKILNLKENKNKYIYSEDILITGAMIFMFKTKPFICSAEPNSIARKLKSLFFNTKLFDKVKILITIRRQDELLKSFYAELYWLFKSIKETNNFDKFFKYVFIENQYNFVADALFYYDIIKTYKELFGKENIKIFLFEELKYDKDIFLNKLSKAMEINFDETKNIIGDSKKNVRIFPSGEYRLNINLINELSKFINENKYINFKFIHKLYKLPPVYNFMNHIKNIANINVETIKELNEEQKKIINEIYTQSNRLLSKEYNLGLEKFGYFDF